MGRRSTFKRMRLKLWKRTRNLYGKAFNTQKEEAQTLEEDAQLVWEGVNIKKEEAQTLEEEHQH
jgi:hypothetical protein